MIGTLTGALIMSVITSGCTQIEVSNPVKDMILGIVIIIAVAVDRLASAEGRWSGCIDSQKTEGKREASHALPLSFFTPTTNLIVIAHTGCV